MTSDKLVLARLDQRNTHHFDWMCHKHEIMEVHPQLPSSFLKPYIEDFIAKKGKAAFYERRCEACTRSMDILWKLKNNL